MQNYLSNLFTGSFVRLSAKFIETLWIHFMKFWKIGIKSGIGRLDFSVSASGLHPDSAKEHTAIVSDVTAQTAVKFVMLFLGK